MLFADEKTYFPDGDIRMKNKEKPSRTRGAYFSVRDLQGGRALTMLFAE